MTDVTPKGNAYRAEVDTRPGTAYFPQRPIIRVYELATVAGLVGERPIGSLRRMPSRTKQYAACDQQGNATGPKRSSIEAVVDWLVENRQES